MIEDGIIDRIDFNKKLLHVEYKLSTLGESLKPVIETIKQLGHLYKEQL